MRTLLVGSLILCAASVEARTYRIRWLLAHDPPGVFERAAKRFSDIVSVVVLDSAQRRRWRRLAEPIYRKFSPLIGKELVKDQSL